MSRWRVSAVVGLILACSVAPAGAQDSIASFEAAWGSGANDVWVVGDGNGALHWDGHAWRQVLFHLEEPPALRAVWGSGPGDVYAVGTAGTMLHWDGHAWHTVASGTDFDLIGVTGRSATEVYAVGESEDPEQPGVLLRYDGRKWTSTPLPFFFQVGGIGIVGADVLVVGTATLMRPDMPDRMVGVVARYSNGRFVVSGFDGKAVTDPVLGGTGWHAISSSGSTALMFGERDGEGSPPNEFVTLAKGQAWSDVPGPAGVTVRYAFVAGDGVPVALWPSGLARYTGGHWVSTTPTTQPAGFADPFAGYGYQSAPHVAWGVSSRDFWAFMEEGVLVHVVGDQASVGVALSCADPTSFINPDIAKYCHRLK